MTPQQRYKKLGAMVRECFKEKLALEHRVRELEEENKRLKPFEAEASQLRTFVESRLRR